MPDLVRTRSTGTVHMPGCGLIASTPAPWSYAASMENFTAIQAETVLYPWLHLCRVCLAGWCRCRRCGPRVTDA